MVNWFKIGKSVLTRGVTRTVLFEGGKYAGQKTAEKYVAYKTKKLWNAGLVKIGLKEEPTPEPSRAEKLNTLQTNVRGGVVARATALARHLEQAGQGQAGTNFFPAPAKLENPETPPQSDGVAQMPKKHLSDRAFVKAAKSNRLVQMAHGVAQGVKQGLKSDPKP